MRKTTLLWASVCLLLSGAFRPLDAAPEREDKENADGTGRPDLCFLDADIGPCSLYFMNYFYNHRSGLCEQFVYGGCKGNLNNFQSEAACQHFCGDPDDSAQPAASSTPVPAKRNAGVRGRPDFCFLDADMGSCRLYFRNYFYNHHSGRCEEFVYGGCQGNLNNFQSEAACQLFCGDPDDSAQPAASSTPGPAKRNSAVWRRPGYCFLDADMGPCGLYFKNYFYNHRSGRCEQFVFGGCDGNLNNFETEADCQHYCGDPDDSAQPAASSTPGPAKRNAGVRGRPDYCFLDADMGPCRLYLRNYFYNHRSGRCEPFVYGGCQGNRNNFQTEATCQHFCRDRDDSAQPAASSTPGPAKRNSSVGRRPDICFLDLDIGPCSLYSRNYYYNHRTGSCEEFLYGGCKGNINNFATEAACQHFCGDPDDSAQPAASSTPGPAKRNSEVWWRPGFCFLDWDMGPCSTNIKRYFYNHRFRRCEEFVYGGCRGNLNNFETEADCQRSCGDPDDSAQPAASSTPTPAKRNATVRGRPDYCFLDLDMGPCSLDLRHYYFNHRTGGCEQFVFGGCKGNLNNFETEAACQRFCGDPDDSAQPAASSTPGPAKRNTAVGRRPHYCFLNADKGPCSLYFRNYYYNHRTGSCEQFEYGGCKGNLNNFVTEAACQHFCGDPDDSAQPAASSTPGRAKRNAAVRAFTKTTPKGRLMETKRRKNSVEIGYEIY